MVSNEMPMDDSYLNLTNESNANVVYEGQKGSAHPLHAQKNFPN